MMRRPPIGPAALSLPGKTFLIGEYLALEGGPSILLATVPRFELLVHRTFESGAEARHPFATQSPAGRWLARHAAETRDYRFEFFDPHDGRGGLGASSAQFALVYSWLRGAAIAVTSAADWASLLKIYRECAWSGEGAPPSGADLVAQMTGGICRFDGRTLETRKFEWKFPRLGFTLVRTGFKLATHEHLKTAPVIPVEALREQVAAATRAFENTSEEALVGAVRTTETILREAGLCAPETLKLLDSLRSENDWALAAKGCGARGADVILILHDRSKGARVEDWVKRQGLRICGTENDLASGLEAKLEVE